MATLIGTVTKVIGQVFAQSADGTKRALVEGDRLFAGDQLITGAEGAVAVHLQNGQELTLGRGSSLTMTGATAGGSGGACECRGGRDPERRATDRRRADPESHRRR